MNTFEKNGASSVRQAWVKPELRRIEAGSAENTGFGRRDGSTSPGNALS